MNKNINNQLTRGPFQKVHQCQHFKPVHYPNPRTASGNNYAQCSACTNTRTQVDKGPLRRQRMPTLSKRVESHRTKVEKRTTPTSSNKYYNTQQTQKEKDQPFDQSLKKASTTTFKQSITHEDEDSQRKGMTDKCPNRGAHQPH